MTVSGPKRAPVPIHKGLTEAFDRTRNARSYNGYIHCAVLRVTAALYIYMRWCKYVLHIMYVYMACCYLFSACVPVSFSSSKRLNAPASMWRRLRPVFVYVWVCIHLFIYIYIYMIYVYCVCVCVMSAACDPY